MGGVAEVNAGPTVAQTRASESGESAPSVSMLLVCAEHPQSDCDEELQQLRLRLELIAERYRLTLTILRHSELPAALAKRAYLGPCLLIFRHGLLVSESVGSRLPSRELDRAVRRAVEWSNEYRNEHPAPSSSPQRF